MQEPTPTFAVKGVSTQPDNITQNRPTQLSFLLRRMLKLRQHPAGLLALVFIVLYLFLAIFGEQIAPYPYTQQHYTDTLKPPSITYWFGTDQFGRDVLSRVIVGSRDVLLLAFTAISFSGLLGLFIGLLAGYYGGLLDELLMRLMDIIMSFPALLLALLILSVYGSNFFNLILTLGIVFAPFIARVVRSAVLDVRSLEYIDAARLRGEGDFYIMTQEILPNIIPVVIVEFSLNFSYTILAGASLGFLGLGVQPPSPDWGLQVNEGSLYALIAPWVVIFPSIAISILVLSINVFADILGRILVGEGES